MTAGHIASRAQVTVMNSHEVCEDMSLTKESKGTKPTKTKPNPPQKTGRFLMCENFEQPSWAELLPTEGPDSDAFDEELYTEFP